MPEVSNLLVVGMGVGVVFIGLICLILVCKIVSAIARIGGPAPATFPCGAWRCPENTLSD